MARSSRQATHTLPRCGTDLADRSGPALLCYIGTWYGKASLESVSERLPKQYRTTTIPMSDMLQLVCTNWYLLHQARQAKAYRTQ